MSDISLILINICLGGYTVFMAVMCWKQWKLLQKYEKGKKGIDRGKS